MLVKWFSWQVFLATCLLVASMLALGAPPSMAATEPDRGEAGR